MAIQPVSTAVSPLTADTAKSTAAGGFAAEMEKAAAAAKEAKADEKLRKTCRDMEAVFLNMMWGCMRATVPKSGLMGDGSKEEIMRSMLDSEMTKNLAQGGGVGLGDLLYRQLSTKSAPVIQNNNQAPK